MNASGAFFPFLSRTASRLLRYDPDSANAIDDMVGRVIAIEFLGPDKTLYIFPELQGLRVAEQSAAPPDVLIKGTPLDLFALGQHGDVAMPGRVEIRGDLGLAQQIQAVVANLDIDWEELVANFTGDFLARKISRFVSGFAASAGHARRSFSTDVSDYLLYEQRLVPRSEELADFLSNVERLRDDVASLDQRVQRLRDKYNG